MHKKQIENLLNLSDKERLEYFIRYTSDFEKVWGLSVGEDNWIIFKDKEGDEIFPLWPHKDLANECMFEEHKKMGAKPQSMSIYSFINHCIPDLENVKFGIFYNINRTAYVLDGNALKEELLEELEQ